MYTIGIKNRIQSQIESHTVPRGNKYDHHMSDQTGATKLERFHLVHNDVLKGGLTQHQVTVPVDRTRFGMRVTIRWWSNKNDICQVALVEGGGRQNGIVSRPFRVLELGTFNGTWEEQMPMVCNRILNLRKEMKNELS